MVLNQNLLLVPFNISEVEQQVLTLSFLYFLNNSDRKEIQVKKIHLSFTNNCFYCKFKTGSGFSLSGFLLFPGHIPL